MLLAGAFAGLTQELDRLGIDQPDATMPALTGSRDGDWAAFAAAYSRVISKVPARDFQQVAAAAMTGMVATLNDNHAHWQYPPPQPPGFTSSDTYGLGINTSPGPGLLRNAPGEALPPAVVTSVDPGSPAARARVRTGDRRTTAPTATDAAAGQPGPEIKPRSPKTTPDDRRTPMALARQRQSARTWTRRLLTATGRSTS